MGAKLDLGKAWSDAVSMLSANKDVVLIIAGVFFFLPNVLFSLLIPEMAEPASPADPQNMEMVYAQLGAMLREYFAAYWWLFLLLGIVQTIGVLGLLTLLTDRNRPTVGEALQIGALGVVTYFIVQLLVLVGFGIMITLAFLPGIVVGGLLLLPISVLMLYVSIKLSLISPVIAIERERNPIAVLQRSWTLTKGNSLRIFAFFVLLIIVLLVLTTIAGLFFGMFSLLGDTVGGMIVAIGDGIISMITTTISLGVLASIYFQLSGNVPSQADVFD